MQRVFPNPWPMCRCENVSHRAFPHTMWTARSWAKDRPRNCGNCTRFRKNCTKSTWSCPSLEQCSCLLLSAYESPIQEQLSCVYDSVHFSLVTVVLELLDWIQLLHWNRWQFRHLPGFSPSMPVTLFTIHTIERTLVPIWDLYWATLHIVNTVIGGKDVIVLQLGSIKPSWNPFFVLWIFLFFVWCNLLSLSRLLLDSA